MEWMFVCPPNSDFESLPHSVSIFGDEDSKAVIKVKWVRKGGGGLILYNQCPYKKRNHRILSLPLPISPLLSLFLLRALFPFSLSMWGLTKKLAVSKPGRGLSGGLCHPFCLQKWQKTNVSCVSGCPVWDCVMGAQDGKDSMYQQAQNKPLGNHMGVRRRFRRR